MWSCLVALPPWHKEAAQPWHAPRASGVILKTTPRRYEKRAPRHLEGSVCAPAALVRGLGGTDLSPPRPRDRSWRWSPQWCSPGPGTQLLPSPKQELCQCPADSCRLGLQARAPTAARHPDGLLVSSSTSVP